MTKTARSHPGIFLVSFFLACLAPTPAVTHALEGSSAELNEYYSREELAQMLAPVALYPDALLAQVLMASTYPIEVVEADRWVRNNPLQGEALDAALLELDWDPSVKAICHFPSVLALMSERIGETTDLGNAFLAQEGEVMEMVQELRGEAYTRGHLTTTSQQKVIVQKETIIIEPASPRIVYVPYYDPLYVYGPWRYPGYPPYYWGPRKVSSVIGISYWPGAYFGFTFASWSHFDWPRRYIFIDVHQRPVFVRHDRWRVDSGRWRHAPHHRRGVAYHHRSVAVKYQPSSPRGGYRRDIRVPDRVVHDRDRTGRRDERAGSDLGRPRDGHSRPDRKGQVQQRAEPRRQPVERAHRERQERARQDGVRQGQQSTERKHQVAEGGRRDRQEGTKKGDRRKQPQVRREPQRVEDTARDRQERSGSDDARQGVQREDAGGKRQERENLDRQRQNRQQQANHSQVARGDDGVTHVETGRGERHSGDRGRSGREGDFGRNGRSGGKQQEWSRESGRQPR